MNLALSELWLPLLLVFLAAGTIKGSVGIGLPTAGVGMMSQFIDPRTAITLMVLPVLFVNMWQMLRSGRIIETLRQYRFFAVSIALTIGLTSLALPYVPTTGLVIALGVIVVVFSITSLIDKVPPLPARYDTPAQITAGIASGFIGGLTSIWAPPVMIYLLSRRPEKEEFVRAVGIMLTAGAIPLTFGFIANGMLNLTTAPISAALTIPALIGFSIGEILRRRLHADRFRTAVLVIFLLMGLNLLRKALF